MSLRYMISIEERTKSISFSIKYGIKRTDSVKDLCIYESVLFSLLYELNIL